MNQKVTLQVKLIHDITIPFESAFLDNGSFSLNHAEYTAMAMKGIHTTRMIDLVITDDNKTTKIPLTPRAHEPEVNLQQAHSNIKHIVIEYGN